MTQVATGFTDLWLGVTLQFQSFSHPWYDVGLVVLILVTVVKSRRSSHVR